MRACTFFISLFSLLVIFTAEARVIKMSIPSSSTELPLSNPGSATTTFDIQCFNASGTQVTNLIAQTVAPNATSKITIGTNPSTTCADGTNEQVGTMIGSGRPYYICGGSTNFANAGNLCGSGQDLCQVGEYQCSSGIYPCTFGTFWMKPPTNWTKSSTACSAGTYVANSGTNYAPAIDSCTGFNLGCRDESNPTQYQSYCQEQLKTANLSGSVCCALTPDVATLCQITIADENQTLSSPVFNGGRAF